MGWLQAYGGRSSPGPPVTFHRARFFLVFSEGPVGFRLYPRARYVLQLFTGPVYRIQDTTGPLAGPVPSSVQPRAAAPDPGVPPPGTVFTTGRVPVLSVSFSWNLGTRTAWKYGTWEHAPRGNTFLWNFGNTHRVEIVTGKCNSMRTSTMYAKEMSRTILNIFPVL